jgi:hypothetical protein
MIEGEDIDIALLSESFVVVVVCSLEEQMGTATVPFSGTLDTQRHENGHRDVPHIKRSKG